MPPSRPPQQPRYTLPVLLVGFLDGLAYSLQVSNHHDIGERRCRDMGGRLLLALGVAVVLTLLTLPALRRSEYYRSLLATEPEFGLLHAIYHLGPYPMYVFCLLIVAGHCRQRWRAAWRRRQGGPPIHSHYDGRPNLLRRWPRLNEEYCKRVIEPLIWGATGVVAFFVAGAATAGLNLRASVAFAGFLQRRKVGFAFMPYRVFIGFQPSSMIGH